ncbi:MAG: type II toxin-antitoxin system VapC family toxin [Oscillospiraceae bacterium]|nr:type II toxin-antitoxin system VapC family toxin [Oscillospiraceae bacterium]
MNGDMLDTNVIIKYLAGDGSAKRLMNNASDISVSAIVVGELQYGAQKSSKTESNLALFASFLSSFTIMPITENIASVYGEVKEQLRKKGVNIPENDIWIAASAKAQNCRLLTFDAHFKSVDGLTVVS